MIYYWETENSRGKFEAESDQKAISRSSSINDLWVLYRENQNSDDGIPFVTLYDHTDS